MKIIINNNSYRSEFKSRTCITHGKYSFTINKKILPQIKIYNISDDDLESIGNDFNTIFEKTEQCIISSIDKTEI